MSLMKVPTTIPKLDEFFKGGIELGSRVLIISDMLIDKAMFGISIMAGRLKEGDNGIYFINNKIPDYIKQNIYRRDILQPGPEEQGGIPDKREDNQCEALHKGVPGGL